FFFFFQAEDGIRDLTVTGVQTCALPIFNGPVFAALDHVAPPQLLAGLAVLAGLMTATWLRSAATEWSLDALAWPMAASLLCAPEIGRASCRERVEISGVCGRLKERSMQV